MMKRLTDRDMADGIIGERETASLKNKLLVEIIVTAEREVNQNEHI